jgi:DNA polymerase III delta' subunit
MTPSATLLPEYQDLIYDAPMWKDIMGHQEQIRQLKGYIESDKVPHALLFAGPQGLGKTKTAREFFKALNCLTSPGDPCQACKPCLMAGNDSHPDLHLVGPEKGWIVVETIRDIISETSLRPFEARKRVIVIEPAERLNKASANALLKTLEEPPEGSLIILVSHKPSLLLPTIVSRCQIIRFTPIGAAVVAGVDPVILRLTSGTLGGLLKRNAADVLAMRSHILGVLKGEDPVGFAERYFSEQEQGGESLGVFLLLLESILRDILVLAHGGGDVINEELRGMDLHGIRYHDTEDLARSLHAVRRGADENILHRYAVSELLMKMKGMM